MAAIKAIYAEAAERNRRGERVHVDHIIPLKGRQVSGLHIETNLRIIPAQENVRKSNKWSPA